MFTLKNQGVVAGKRYWHDLVAYNYRMTNLCAAIGVAQLERVDKIIKRKRDIAEIYRSELAGLPMQVHKESNGTFHSYWLTSIILDQEFEVHRDGLMTFLEIMTSSLDHFSILLTRCQCTSIWQKRQLFRYQIATLIEVLIYPVGQGYAMIK